MKKLLILGGGTLQVAVILKAKEMGLFTVVIDGDPNAKGFAFADKKIIHSISDIDSLFYIAKQENIHGVIHPCSEIAIRAMGKINEAMGLSGIFEETAIKVTNKEKMRNAFKENNAPSPISYGASNILDAFNITKKITGDIIIKPSRNSGSRGVTRIPADPDYDEIIIAFDRAMENSYDESVVIEQYIDGPEFSVEIVIWKNNPKVITVTDKLTTGNPYFVELGHSQPSQFSEQELNSIKNAAISGCIALGLDNCVVHAEIKLHDNIPYIIEIGARLGGDFISTVLVHLSTGVDLTAAAIDIAMGNEPNLKPNHEVQGAAIRYFTPNEGKLTKLLLPNLNNNCKVVDFEIYKKIGDIISPIKSSLDRSGHIITTGSDAQDAIILAEMCLNSIEYNIEVN